MEMSPIFILCAWGRRHRERFHGKSCFPMIRLFLSTMWRVTPSLLTGGEAYQGEHPLAPSFLEGSHENYSFREL
jgi:hypothetical protein